LKIGIDFDNTIVNYDLLFFDVALKLGLIPSKLDKSKFAVKKYLHQVNKNNEWTLLQGLVYGEKMPGALIYEGFKNFVDFASKEKVELCIISHKTLYPFLGKKFNLHKSAKSWIAENLNHNSEQFIDQENTFFEISQDLKVSRIKQQNCDYFIDDLPEIFENENFPTQTTKLLFCPNTNPPIINYKVFQSWSLIKKFLQHELRS